MSEKIDNFVIEAGQSASNMREQILNKKVFDVTDQKVPQIIVGTGDSDKVKNLSLHADGALFGKNNNGKKELVSTKINDLNYDKVFRKDPLYLSNSLKNITDNQYKIVLQNSSDFYCLDKLKSTKISAISPATGNGQILGQIKRNNVTKPFYIENYQMKEAVGITSNKNRHYIFTIEYYGITIEGNDIYVWEQPDAPSITKLSSTTAFRDGYPYVSRVKIEVVFDEREIDPTQKIRTYSNAYLKLYVNVNYQKVSGTKDISFADTNQLVMLYPVQVTAEGNGFTIKRVGGSYFSVPLVDKHFSLILPYQTDISKSLILTQKDWNLFIDKALDRSIGAPTALHLAYNHETSEFSGVSWNILVGMWSDIVYPEPKKLGVRYYESE